MNRIFTIVSAVLLSASLWAQSPQSFSYQAVVRGANNVLVANKKVGIKISLLQGSEIGTAVYAEIHTPTSNENGLVSIAIGGGSIESGTFASVDWANGPYFVKTETDAAGGTNYSLTTTSQLLSVPYALYAGNSQPGSKGEKGDSGTQGLKGDQGLNGDVGTKGDKGDAGSQGLTGANGLPGAAGAKGDKGDKGDIGAQGLTGANGLPGVAGSKGDKGDTGAQGLTGANGLPGTAGSKGDKGDAGADGKDGLNGTLGAKGDQGITGDQGLTGVVGAKGDTGAQGLTGTNGLSGTAGLKGDQGLTGVVGAKGDTGAQGLTGANGLSGTAGLKGDQGLKGDVGTTGPVGNGFSNGTAKNQIMYWNGNAWVTLNPGTNDQFLTISNGNLIWTLIPGYAKSITDIDGNLYKTVNIGNQQWMAENLKVTKYNDGTDIPNVTGYTEWTQLTTGAWTYYNNDIANNVKYGKLYNWYAVSPTANGNKNVCPTGWHVPNDAEWTVLTDYLGGVAGGKMKEVGTTSWISPNTDATNTSLFTGLPGGARLNGGGYYDIGYIGYWWSSLENNYNAWYRDLKGNNGNAGRNGGFNKKSGLFVRCLRD